MQPLLPSEMAHILPAECFSLNKSTSYLSLYFSLNSLCDEASRTSASLSPDSSLHDLPWVPKLLIRGRAAKKPEAKFQGLEKLIRRRQWHPTPVLLPGKSHGQKSLVGCGPWGC